MFSMQIVSNERGTAAGGELVNPSVLTLGSRTRRTAWERRQPGRRLMPRAAWDERCSKHLPCKGEEISHGQWDVESFMERKMVCFVLGFFSKWKWLSCALLAKPKAPCPQFHLISPPRVHNPSKQNPSNLLQKIQWKGVFSKYKWHFQLNVFLCFL